MAKTHRRFLLNGNKRAALFRDAHGERGPMSSEAQHAEERVVDTATGAEAPTEISEERVQHITSSNVAKQYARFNAVSEFRSFQGLAAQNRRRGKPHARKRFARFGGRHRRCELYGGKPSPPGAYSADRLRTYEMLDVAREREAAGAACGVPIDFEVVDAQEIPYADSSYDAVTVAYGIRNIPDRMKALREVHRRAEAGREPWPAWNSRPHRTRYGVSYSRIYLKVMIPFWGQVFTHDRPSFVYLADSTRAFPDQEHYAQMLRDAGFSDVSWKSYAGGIVAVHTGHK